LIHWLCVCWLTRVCVWAVDLATECYEHACSKFPGNLELMMGLFNCYVREYSFVKQQQVCICMCECLFMFYILFVFTTYDLLLSNWQTAIKMYKLVGEERFLLWAVCSIQLQVLPSSLLNKLSFAVSLKEFISMHYQFRWNKHDQKVKCIWRINKKGKYI